jgi:hypothetical protein
MTGSIGAIQIGMTVAMIRLHRWPQVTCGEGTTARIANGRVSRLRDYLHAISQRRLGNYPVSPPCRPFMLLRDDDASGKAVSKGYETGQISAQQ